MIIQPPIVRPDTAVAPIEPRQVNPTREAPASQRVSENRSATERRRQDRRKRQLPVSLDRRHSERRDREDEQATSANPAVGGHIDIRV